MKKTFKTLLILGALSIPALYGGHDADAATKYLTKEQTMKQIKQADGKQKKVKTFTTKTYKDVKTSNTSVKWAYERGFISKTKSGYYKPKNYITREQAAKALVRGLNVKPSKKAGKTKDAKTKELKILDSWNVLPKDRKGKFNPSGKLTDDQFWKLADAAFDAKDKYTLSKKPNEVDLFYTQPGEKVPSYAKALDYNGYKKEMDAITYDTNNKYKVKVLYIKKVSYIKTYRERMQKYYYYSETVKNPFVYSAPTHPYGPQKRGNVIRLVVDNGAYVSDKKLKASEAQFDKYYSEIKSKYKPKTDYDVLVAVTEYVANKFEYNDHVSKYNGIFADTDGWLQCTEYAEVSGYLLKKFGIETRYLSGDMHAWLGVKIGGHWYHNDPTFQSSTGTNDYTIMTDSMRFGDDVDSYYDDSMRIKTPKMPFNPKNALPINYK